MSERATAASSDVNRLFGDEITAATSQTESRTAITATPTPRTASTLPEVVTAQRDVAVGAERPRPTQPSPAGRRHDQGDDHDRAGRRSRASVCSKRDPDQRRRARKPSQNPPKVRIWTSAPRRRPWTAASSISPTISRSTQSTGSEGSQRCPRETGPHHYSRPPCAHSVASRSAGPCPGRSRIAIAAARHGVGASPAGVRAVEPPRLPPAPRRPGPARGHAGRWWASRHPRAPAQLGAVSCATARALLGRRRGRPECPCRPAAPP